MGVRFLATCDDCGHRRVHIQQGGALRDLARHDCHAERIARDLREGDFAVIFTARDGWQMRTGLLRDAAS